MKSELGVCFPSTLSIKFKHQIALHAYESQYDAFSLKLLISGVSQLQCGLVYKWLYRV